MASNASSITHVTLGDSPLTLDEFVAVARFGAQITFTPAYVERVNASSALVDRFLAENRLIYGVTTGFGDNYTTVIAPEDAARLQENIVISHAVSVGAPLPEELVRAVQLMTLQSLGQGYSGTRIETLDLIRELLNKRITPVAPGDGSVGYLSVEAHLALVLIGQGKATYQGTELPGAEALAKAGLRPVTLKAKEGLTLTNGSHSVTGIAALATHEALRQSRVADLVTALGFESLGCTTRHYDARLQALRQFPEQAATARNLLRILDGSEIAAANVDNRIQDPLMYRAVPQAHGGARRFINDAAVVISEAMYSVGDNPALIPDGTGNGYANMGGNFDGTYLSLAADSITTASTVYAKYSERRTDRLVNSNFSGLPAFLAPHPGLNNGHMIPQYTAAALVMEMRGEAFPASVDSISTSANQEDPVSNAYLAARQAYRVTNKLTYVHAIELLSATQAADLLPGSLNSSPALQALRKQVREVVPFAENDRLFGLDIEALARLVTSDELLASVEAVTGPLEF